MPNDNSGRRRFLGRVLATGGSLLLAGCDRLSQTEWFPNVLSSAEKLTQAAQKLIVPRNAMAQEFSPADISPEFRSNGTSNPNNPVYQALAADGFKDYQLKISGLVEHPAVYSLAELKALPSRSQITRHDCVEGWSAIGKWQGVRLSQLLQRAQPKAGARYAVFYCADPMDAWGTTYYYESIDLDEANHPQTLLAYALNDADLPIKNGAPIRLRVERQLGYKMAKYVMEIKLVDSFADIAGGKGGYWEDRGYEWFAGI
ncbi:MAG: molybdopterin-binding protein [Thiobacillus sp.]|nr:molybdopterin-binding protein [Thiobacillus sp.]